MLSVGRHLLDFGGCPAKILSADENNCQSDRFLPVGHEGPARASLGRRAGERAKSIPISYLFLICSRLLLLMMSRVTSKDTRVSLELRGGEIREFI